MTIYADEVFAVNLVSNLLLLYAFVLIERIKPRHGRIWTAAGFGGLYAVFEAIFSIVYAFRGVVLMLMTALAFGIKGMVIRLVKLMMICVIVEGVTVAIMSVIGAEASLASGVITIFASEPVTAAVYLFVYPAIMAAKRITDTKKAYRQIFVKYNGRHVEFKVLYDSGNLLKYHGIPVITVSWTAVSELFDCCGYDELESESRDFVLFSTISSAGAMPVFSPEILRVDGQAAEAVIAVTNRVFGNKYDGIAGEIKLC